MTQHEFSRTDLIETIELCIQEDGMTWPEAVKQYRQQTGFGLMACRDLGERWKIMQINATRAKGLAA